MVFEDVVVLAHNPLIAISDVAIAVLLYEVVAAEAFWD